MTQLSENLFSLPCRFCGRMFEEHNDPPTQQMCATSCLGSKCNFQARQSERETVVAQPCAACLMGAAQVEERTFTHCMHVEKYPDPETGQEHVHDPNKKQTLYQCVHGSRWWSDPFFKPCWCGWRMHV
jgi:hypothetical protein